MSSPALILHCRHQAKHHTPSSQRIPLSRSLLDLHLCQHANEQITAPRKWCTTIDDCGHPNMILRMSGWDGMGFRNRARNNSLDGIKAEILRPPVVRWVIGIPTR
ncbi:hypothetical protein CPC08DRAFT_716836 [Agrocybe pediades]|nr:hypothetical protein CPC08DRAFT_716836 [Agrocybe pediades]